MRSELERGDVAVLARDARQEAEGSRRNSNALPMTELPRRSGRGAEDGVRMRYDVLRRTGDESLGPLEPRVESIRPVA